MLSFRAHAWICALAFALLLGVPTAGNILAASGVLNPPSRPSILLLGLMFGLVLAFALSFVPVMVMLASGGRAQRGAARRYSPAQKLVVWALWGLMLAGSVVAIPVALHDLANQAAARQAQPK